MRMQFSMKDVWLGRQDSEPANGGIKSRCLAWRRPSIDLAARRESALYNGPLAKAKPFAVPVQTPSALREQGLESHMATPPPSSGASPLFLREEEIRRGIELLHFSQAEIARATDTQLQALGLGRADQRVLYFIARRPELSVSDLLRLLRHHSKQSLGRVLDPLVERGLVEIIPGKRDRRQRLLRVTAEGARIETELFATIRERMAQAYSQAGQGSVTGFWRVLETLIAPEDARHRRCAGDQGLELRLWPASPVPRLDRVPHAAFARRAR